MKMSIRKMFLSLILLVSAIFPWGVSTPAAASAPAATVCATNSTAAKPSFTANDSGITFYGKGFCSNGIKSPSIYVTVDLYKNSSRFATKSFTCFNTTACAQTFHIANIASVGTWYVKVTTKTPYLTVIATGPSLVIRLSASGGGFEE